MNTKKPQVCDVKESPFRNFLIFLRKGGVPTNMKYVSIPYSIYNILLAVNDYVPYLAFYMDIIIHNDDLKNFINTFRVLNSISGLYWLHLNLRYIKH
jgi:hypothetical protein